MKQKCWNKLRAIILRQKPFLERAFIVQSTKVRRVCLIKKTADLFAAIDLSSFVSELEKSCKLEVVVSFA